MENLNISSILQPLVLLSALPGSPPSPLSAALCLLFLSSVLSYTQHYLPTHIYQPLHYYHIPFIVLLFSHFNVQHAGILGLEGTVTIIQYNHSPLVMGPLCSMIAKWLSSLCLYVSSNGDVIASWAVCSTLDSSSC